MSETDTLKGESPAPYKIPQNEFMPREEGAIPVGIQPCGTYILLEATKTEEYSAGGIALPEELLKKEDMVEQSGRILAIGPCAFVGWKGCDLPDKTPAECWGIKVGDLIEHRKYNGLDSKVKGFENLRYIPDVDILGVIEESEE